MNTEVNQRIIQFGIEEDESIYPLTINHLFELIEAVGFISPCTNLNGIAIIRSNLTNPTEDRREEGILEEHITLIRQDKGNHLTGLAH